MLTPLLATCFAAPHLLLKPPKASWGKLWVQTPHTALPRGPGSSSGTQESWVYFEVTPRQEDHWILSNAVSFPTHQGAAHSPERSCTPSSREKASDRGWSSSTLFSVPAAVHYYSHRLTRYRSWLETFTAQLPPPCTPPGLTAGHGDGAGGAEARGWVQAQQGQRRS